MSNITPATAGIDTSKEKLDVAIVGIGSAFSVGNAADGWNQLVSHFRHHAVGRVSIEATGGYERGVVRHLRTAGFSVVVLQPLQVKAFAKLHRRRAKTDQLDAQLIADCTTLIDETGKLPPDPRLDELCDHLTYIEQIEEDIARLKTRIEHITLHSKQFS